MIRNPKSLAKSAQRSIMIFHLNGWRFIVLDGNEISTFANLPIFENYTACTKLAKIRWNLMSMNANFWNGGIGKNNCWLEWLKDVLLIKNNEMAVIFCHYPIFPPNKHNLLNDKELLTLLKNYEGVKMWINGHNHNGNYGLFDNIHFVNVKGWVEETLQHISIT
jgi:manganese-dependent ADP-ribose/CDP-alcohol diphosphatase